MRKSIVTLLLLAPAAPVLAAEANGGGLLGPSLKAVGALALVLALVLFLYYALTRKGFGLLPAAKSGQIQVVEMRSLGPKKGLCLVRVRGEEFLLGIGGDRIELLTPVKGAAGSFEQSLQAQLGERS